MLEPYMEYVHLEIINIKLSENRDKYSYYKYEIPVLHVNDKLFAKNKEITIENLKSCIEKYIVK